MMKIPVRNIVVEYDNDEEESFSVRLYERVELCDVVWDKEFETYVAVPETKKSFVVLPYEGETLERILPKKMYQVEITPTWRDASEFEISACRKALSYNPYDEEGFLGKSTIEKLRKNKLFEE